MLWNPAMAPEIPSTVVGARRLDATRFFKSDLQGGLVVTVVLGEAG